MAAVFEVRNDDVSMCVSGAKVDMDAKGYGFFSAQVPFDIFKNICNDRYKKDTLITFLFDHKQITVRGLTYRSGDIIFRKGSIRQGLLFEDSQDNHKETTTDNIPDMMEGFVGLPLLEIYYHLRRYPPGALARNARIVAGEQEIEKILNKVDRLLKPLGLGRHTIEKILDDKKPYK
jgi:hypothetical protein